jgi:hypothetical protein
LRGKASPAFGYSRYSVSRQPIEQEEYRSSGVQEFRSSGVQEFRSSGVQDSPEREDLPGDRSDLTGLFLGYNPPLEKNFSGSPDGGVRITISLLSF